ncbi:hypothetical protein WAI453_004799 [Rhynchosporium graminicola]|uniref:Related to endo-1,3-beta-glucanase n=1 Tax=Rhynchosporium graminicola TaxID=2792576 RepID=A0A1E1LG45_9HELO|nr:related to endo-1,3-beta-glucanase [Rhynchosporium commune]
MASFILSTAMLMAVGAAASVPKIDGFTLTWSDDFSGPAKSLPDPKNWILDIGTSYPGGAQNWGTGETQTYTDSPDNIALSGDGKLIITPLRHGTGNTTKWTSARIETQRKDFEPAPGGKLRIQGRIQMPDVSGEEAAGYWPAFWTLGGRFRGNFTNWPVVGEIDILENVNGIDKVWSTLHCDVAPGGKCNESSGLGKTSPCGLGKPCQGYFHTYAVEIDRSTKPEQMTWEVDGTVYHTLNETALGEAVWLETVADGGHMLLLNVAMGGGFPDAFYKNSTVYTPIPETRPGVPMIVDYVAVYNSIDSSYWHGK